MPSNKDKEKFNRLGAEVASSEGGPNQLFRITVVGNSMKPTLLPGDALFLVPGRGVSLKIGELVTFMTGTGPITHRLLKIENETILTKGDNVRSFDPSVPRTQIIGKVVTRSRAGVETNLLDRTGAAWVSRMSYLEGWITDRFPRALHRSLIFKFVNLPFRFLVRIFSN